MKQNAVKIVVVGTSNIDTRLGGFTIKVVRIKEGGDRGKKCSVRNEKAYLKRLDSSGTINLIAAVLLPMPFCAWPTSNPSNSNVRAPWSGLIASDGGVQLSSSVEVGNSFFPAKFHSKIAKQDLTKKELLEAGNIGKEARQKMRIRSGYQTHWKKKETRRTMQGAEF